jgi:hypothetical protein
MTRDSRNPNNWSTREIEEDSAGYRAAQQACRQDEAVAAAQRQEQLDKERFTAAFVVAGGTRADAHDAYRQRVNEEATLAARTADETARLAQRGATMGRL